MRTFAALLLIWLSVRSEAWGPNHPGAMNNADRLGAWEDQRSADAGISVQMPCKASESADDDYQDGYGHKQKMYQLRCTKDLSKGKASFQVTRITYPADGSLASQSFQRYMTLVGSNSNNRPTVELAGQQREVHFDYVLKQRSIRGDLGFHDLSDSCMWNFMGLDGTSEVQAIMRLPRSMCPVGGEPIMNGIASRFFDSILYVAG